MSVYFEISAFKNNPKGLIAVLSNLRAVGSWTPRDDKEVEDIVCRTPSSALSFCGQVNGAYGISAGAERVFLKNPKLGIRYLRTVNRSSFRDPDTQKRFWRKVTRDAGLCLDWAFSFGRRLSEEEEAVFVDDPVRANQYATRVIRGPFPEKVHHMLLLKSFDNLDRYSKNCLDLYIKFAEKCAAGAST